MNMKFNIEGNEVEVTTNTGNNMKYMFVINNKRAYLKDKPVEGSESYDSCEFLVRKYYLNGIYCTKQDFLNKIIMFFEGKFNSEESVEIHEMCETPYVASPIPEGFDAEAEEDDNEDLTIVEKVVKKVKKGISKIRKESLYDLSNRVFNIKGNLCKAPLMPSLDKDYDESYYGRFEVKPRFYNWDGSSQLI